MSRTDKNVVWYMAHKRGKQTEKKIIEQIFFFKKKREKKLCRGSREEVGWGWGWGMGEEGVPAVKILVG